MHLDLRYLDICWKTRQNTKQENNCTVISSSADNDIRNLFKADNTEHIRQTKRSILTLYWEILLNEMFFYDTNVTKMAGKSVLIKTICISKCLNIKFIHIHVLTVVFAKASNTIIIELTLSKLYVHYHSKSHFLQQFRFIWLEGNKWASEHQGQMQTLNQLYVSAKSMLALHESN